MLAETSASSAKMRDEESRRHTEETEHLRRHLWKYPDDTYERTQHRLVSPTFGFVSPALGLVSPAL
eukprot:2349705-Pyramimonas_sp.AAC.1